MNLSALRARLRLPGPALDVHTHPFRDFGPGGAASPAEDARRMAEESRRAGVERLCVSSVHPAFPESPTIQQCREANDYVLRLRDERPEVFLPFCYVTPADPEASVAEIDRCVGSERMVGVKLWVARRAVDPGLDPILARTAALGAPVLQHAWRKTVGQLVGESWPGDVADLARRHPRAGIVMAHLNGINPRGLEEVSGWPNLGVDTSGGDPESGMVELAVARLGAQRVLYGSDAPIRHFAVSLSKVLGAELPDPVKRDILWNNAARLLPPWAGVSLV